MTCSWAIDDYGGDSVWETQCGRNFYFDAEDGPLDCGFKWCPYCGKPLSETRTTEDAADCERRSAVSRTFRSQ